MQIFKWMPLKATANTSADSHTQGIKVVQAKDIRNNTSSSSSSNNAAQPMDEDKNTSISSTEMHKRTQITPLSSQTVTTTSLTTATTLTKINDEESTETISQTQLHEKRKSNGLDESNDVHMMLETDDFYHIARQVTDQLVTDVSLTDTTTTT